jgi:hypothetical protein
LITFGNATFIVVISSGSINARFANLRTICSALEHFFLPAALGSIEDDALVIWNPAFQKRAGVSEKELAQARLTSLILLDESYSGIFLQDRDPEHVVRFVPCVLKKSLTNELVHGCALRRNDGWLLAMPGLPTGDIAFEGLIHGRFVGREEERNRTRQFFHDILSSKILIASFIAHEIYQRLVANGAQEAKELGRVTTLLQETIRDISYGFEEPAMRAEIIPERETESLNRLLDS